MTASGQNAARRVERMLCIYFSSLAGWGKTGSLTVGARCGVVTVFMERSDREMEVLQPVPLQSTDDPRRQK